MVFQVTFSRKEIRQHFISKGQHRSISMNVTYFAPAVFLQRGDEPPTGIIVQGKLNGPNKVYISGEIGEYRPDETGTDVQ